MLIDGAYLEETRVVICNEEEIDDFDPDQEKSIVTAARDFINKDIDWEIKKEEEPSEDNKK